MQLRPATSPKLSQLRPGLDPNPLSQRCTLDLQDLLVSLVEEKTCKANKQVQSQGA